MFLSVALQSWSRNVILSQNKSIVSLPGGLFFTHFSFHWCQNLSEHKAQSPKEQGRENPVQVFFHSGEKEVRHTEALTQVEIRLQVLDQTSENMAVPHAGVFRVPVTSTLI